MLDPSEPTNTDFMCFSPTTLLLTGFKFSIRNLGSGFPEPNGDNALTLLKNSILTAEGAILQSRNNGFTADRSILIPLNLLKINSLNFLTLEMFIEKPTINP